MKQIFNVSGQRYMITFKMSECRPGKIRKKRSDRTNGRKMPYFKSCLINSMADQGGKDRLSISSCPEV